MQHRVVTGRFDDRYVAQGDEVAALAVLDEDPIEVRPDHDARKPLDRRCEPARVDGLHEVVDRFDRERAIGQKIGGAIGSLTKEQYAAQALAYAKTQVTSEADAQTIAGWAKDVDPAAVGRAMSELFSRDLRADLARLQAPLLLLGSSADDNASAAEIYQQQIAAAPQHRFIHLTSARHFIMYDATDRFLQIVDRFLTCDDLKTCEL
jgi:pimeloyl-ACP methyl ester carboxylesterase